MSSLYNLILKHIPYRTRLMPEYWTFLRTIHQSELHGEPPQKRFNRLKKLIESAVQQTEFYREFYGDHGIDIRRIRNFKDIEMLPILNRQIVKENIKKIIPDGITPHRWFNTTGTTGCPMEIPVTRKYLQREIAVMHYFFRLSGFRPDSFRLEGRHTSLEKSYFRDYATRTIKLPDKVEKTESDKLKVLMNSFDIRYISGYPSRVHRFCDFVSDTGNSGLADLIRGVFLFSEQVYLNQFSAIRKTFKKALVSCHYGQVEGVASGISLDGGKTYRFISPYGFTESFRGRLLATGFVNDALPLIRYDTGDTTRGEIANNNSIELQRCRLEGRYEDIPLNSSGQKISPARLTFPLKQLLFIDHVKILQHRDKNVTLCYYGTRKLSEKETDMIETEFGKILGDQITISTEFKEKAFFCSDKKYKWIESCN